MIFIKDLDCFNIKQDYYGITEDGQIYSKILKRFLSTRIMKDGYEDLLLICKDGTRRHFRVHRLVAMTYLENPNDYPIVLHLDNNKLNNHYTNLKWGTISENTQQAYSDDCCTCNKHVYLYDKEGNFIKEFVSLSELARYFGYSVGNITVLGLYAEGKKPMPSRGKLKNYIITYEAI